MAALIRTQGTCWFHRWFPVLRWSPSSPKLLKEAEEKLISYVSSPSEGWYVDVGDLNGDSCRIWTRRFGPNVANAANAANGAKLPLVMIHGMGAGLALFALNYDELAKDRTVYAIDLPGFARSSRPRFKSDSAEQDYVAALEAWRKTVGLDRMCLCGHSFGGYLSSAYALRHPDRIGHLILADPWGLPAKPADYERKINAPLWLRGLYHVFKHFNPLTTLRLSGPYGPSAIKRMRPDLIRKFGALFDSEEENAAVIPDYMFHCNAHAPTGESAFTSLMTGFAWAKDPMFPRLANLHQDLPLTVIYGSDTWMSIIEPTEFVAVRNKADSEEPYTNVKILRGAGHHVYVDQHLLFNREVLKACKMVDGKKDGGEAKDVAPEEA